MKHIRQQVRDTTYSVREISEAAAEREDIIRLDIGQPNFDTPEVAKKAAREATQNQVTYTPLWGIDSLRETIASFESHKADYTKENIMVTTGGIGALFSVFSTIAGHDETILFNDPCWSVYSMITNASPATYRQTPFFDDTGVAEDQIESAIDESTRAIVVNNPQNPTGRRYTKEELETIAGIAERNDISIIADEVYDRLVYDEEHIPMASIAPDRTLTINSMSKNFAMTGWRIGWVATTDTDLLHHMGKLNRATTACPNFIAQYAAEAAITEAQEYVKEMRQTYHERRDMVVETMKTLGLDSVRPEGSIYAFPDVTVDSWTAAKELLHDYDVAVVPGEPSGPDSDTHIRLCFGSADKDQLEEGLNRIAQYIDERD